MSWLEKMINRGGSRDVYGEDDGVSPTIEVVGAKEFSPRAKEVLERKSCYIHLIQPKSLTQILAESLDSFECSNNPSLPVMNLVPPIIEVAVAVHPRRKIAIPLHGSCHKTLEEQFKMIKKYKRHLDIPDTRVVIATISICVQLDNAYQEERGAKLIVGFYTRTSDILDDFNNGATVGRISHRSPLSVGSWPCDEKAGHIQVLPVIIPS